MNSYLLRLVLLKLAIKKRIESDFGLNTKTPALT
ncbi:hypothetical protein VIMY103929_08645 [Vibrio mytili]